MAIDLMREQYDALLRDLTTLETEHPRDTLKQLTGIRDEAVIDTLVAMHVNRDTLAAFGLYLSVTAGRIDHLHRRIDTSRLAHIVAAHLSQQNNTPELARAALPASTALLGFCGAPVTFAARVAAARRSFAR